MPKVQAVLTKHEECGKLDCSHVLCLYNRQVTVFPPAGWGYDGFGLEDGRKTVCGELHCCDLLDEPADKSVEEDISRLRCSVVKAPNRSIVASFPLPPSSPTLMAVVLLWSVS